MSMGPITIFDKSALQSLSVNEACWFSHFYRANITPLFFVETLADLSKEMRKGRSPEQIVGNIALKTPILGAAPNVHHSTLCTADFLGHAIQMGRIPVVDGGRTVLTGDQRGIMLEQPPEMDALQRWQSQRFLEVERQFARTWRRMLVEINHDYFYKWARQAAGGRLRIRDLAEAKAWADRAVRGDGRRYQTLRTACSVLGVPGVFAPRITARWKALGGPPLLEFAPYAAHVMTVDLFFHLSLAADLISCERPSNKIDIAYLYYLPFCMIFTSGDKLHARTVPLFLKEDQAFVFGRDLKQELARIDTYFSAFPEEEKKRGIMKFAPDPPREGDYLTSRLWDRFLFGWRNRIDHTATLDPEAERKVMERVRAMIAAAKTGSRKAHFSSDDADFLISSRSVPIKMGKWFVLPPELADADD